MVGKGRKGRKGKERKNTKPVVITISATSYSVYIYIDTPVTCVTHCRCFGLIYTSKLR